MTVAIMVRGMMDPRMTAREERVEPVSVGGMASCAKWLRSCGRTCEVSHSGVSCMVEGVY